MKYFRQNNIIYDCESVINDCIEVWEKFAFMFEEIFDRDIDLVRPWFDDYKEIISKIKKLQAF